MASRVDLMTFMLIGYGSQNDQPENPQHANQSEPF